MKKWDVTILTENRYLNPKIVTSYHQQVLDEDNYVLQALKSIGLKTQRLSWSDPNFDWSTTKIVLIRTTWDYFHRFDEFNYWLQKIDRQSVLVNSSKLINWNIDKHYLFDLKTKGVNIPPTFVIEAKSTITLKQIFNDCAWEDAILKPCISGTARHTYRVNINNINKVEKTFIELISREAMMLQEFQKKIVTEGEKSLMVFQGKFTHAVLKKAKPGDFRVQDDFGGTVTAYNASEKEIAFAENVMQSCPETPIYGRVDIFNDNKNELSVAEVEVIEPELWFRINPEAANLLASIIANNYFN